MTNSDKSSQNPQSPHHAETGDADTESDAKNTIGPEESADVSSTPAAPSADLRAARLRRIQHDVDHGKYDSDELLDQAVEIMLKRMADGTE